MSCCPPGSLSFLAPNNSLHQGRTTSVDCDHCHCEFYVSIPGDDYSNFVCDKGLIMIPDIYGWNGGHMRVIADDFAKNEGFAVVIPKLLTPPLDDGTDGDGFPGDFSFQARGADFGIYMSKFPWEVLKPKVQCSIDFLKARGATKISMIGFCWGGWVVTHALSDPSTSHDLVSGISPHPSITLEERIFKRSTVDLFGKVTRPMLLLPAGNDPHEYLHDGAFFRVLHAKNPESEVHHFPDMTHGFVARGDRSDPAVAEQAAQAIGYTKRFLAKVHGNHHHHQQHHQHHHGDHK